MLAPALPLYAQQLGTDFGWIGLLVSLQGVGALASDVPAGLLVARFGGRAALMLGAGFSALGALALGLSQSSAQLFLAVFVFGVGLAVWATARLAFVATVARPAQRGRALALVGGSSRIGMTAGPIAGGLIAEAFGLQAAFFGHALCATLALLLVSTERSPESTRPAAPSSERAHTRVLQTAFEHRRELATSGGVAIALVALRTTNRMFVPLWGAWIGLDLIQIGWAIGLASAVDMTLFYPVGVIMDRFGRKWTIVPCMLLLSASLLAMPFTTGFYAFLGVALLGGFGNGLGSGAIMTMGADLAPPGRFGEFLGVWRLIGDSGVVVAPALAGALAQALTLGAAFFSTAGIGVAGALLMVLAVREGRHRSPEPVRD